MQQCKHFVYQDDSVDKYLEFHLNFDGAELGTRFWGNIAPRLLGGFHMYLILKRKTTMHAVLPILGSFLPKCFRPIFSHAEFCTAHRPSTMGRIMGPHDMRREAPRDHSPQGPTTRTWQARTGNAALSAIDRRPPCRSTILVHPVERRQDRRVPKARGAS